MPSSADEPVTAGHPSRPSPATGVLAIAGVFSF